MFLLPVELADPEMGQPFSSSSQCNRAERNRMTDCYICHLANCANCATEGVAAVRL